MDVEAHQKEADAVDKDDHILKELCDVCPHIVKVTTEV
jgi:hypothetical protein